MTHEEYGRAYQKGFEKTVRILRSRGASVHYAEDVAQAAWLQGWRKLDQLRDESMIVSWVMSIAINYYHRGSRMEARYQDLPELCGAVGVDVARLDAAKILGLCPPEDRMLFEHQLGGFTNEEIGKQQGVSATAIRIRLFRARRSVKTRIDERASQLRQFAMRERRSVTAA